MNWKVTIIACSIVVLMIGGAAYLFFSSEVGQKVFEIARMSMTVDQEHFQNGACYEYKDKKLQRCLYYGNLDNAAYNKCALMLSEQYQYTWVKDKQCSTQGARGKCTTEVGLAQQLRPKRPEYLIYYSDHGDESWCKNVDRGVWKALSKGQSQELTSAQVGATKYGTDQANKSDPFVEPQNLTTIQHSLGREVFNKELADLAGLLKQARVIPKISSQGQVEGFEFVQIKKGSLFEILKFQEGDVIIAINGEDMSDPTKVMRLYPVLTSKDLHSVIIRRKEQFRKHVYTIK